MCVVRRARLARLVACIWTLTCVRFSAHSSRCGSRSARNVPVNGCMEPFRTIRSSLLMPPMPCTARRCRTCSRLCSSRSSTYSPWTGPTSFSKPSSSRLCPVPLLGLWSSTATRWQTGIWPICRSSSGSCRHRRRRPMGHHHRRRRSQVQPSQVLIVPVRMRDHRRVPWASLFRRSRLLGSLVRSRRSRATFVSVGAVAIHITCHRRRSCCSLTRV